MKTFEYLLTGELRHLEASLVFELNDCKVKLKTERERLNQPGLKDYKALPTLVRRYAEIDNLLAAVRVALKKRDRWGAS
jgi:hypothetical protein